jgi:hypothetical protein
MQLSEKAWHTQRPHQPTLRDSKNLTKDTLEEQLEVLKHYWQELPLLQPERATTATREFSYRVFNANVEKKV